jgi:oxygen-independent coproporphyrinogen-3 oxidase
MENMVKAMKLEIEMRAKNWPLKQLETVYFGGGTPSILPVHLLESLLQTIHNLFDLSNVKEVTLEANPDDMSKNNILAWKAMGFNRLSIGLQSGHNERLAWMNRIHTAEEGKNAVQLAQNLGIENISLDLMYNFPQSTEAELEVDMQSIMALSPKHISAYELTIEPKTVFGKRLEKGELVPAPEENAARQFVMVSETLQSAGFEHYEIASFGLPGFHAVHNSNYWMQKPYLAIGPGAHGSDGKIRTKNKPNNALYIKSLLEEKKLFQQTEILSKVDIANEMIITRMRTKWGLSIEELTEKTGFNLRIEKGTELKSWAEQGFIIIKDDIITLSQNGKLLADRIAVSLMY